MLLKFLKGLIIPNYMVRFKTMNLFFSIAIFFISSFVLALPQMYHTSNKRYETIDLDPPYDLVVFEQLTSSEIEQIRDLGVKITNGAIQDRGNAIEYNLYHFPTNDYDLFFSFDFYDTTNEEETFNEEIFEEFSKIETEGKKILVVFYLDFCVYLLPNGSMDLQYDDIELDFKTIDEGKDFSYRFIDMFLPLIYRGITFQSFVSCVIYPFVVIVLVWILFKSNGNILSFKEYYNLGSISAIIPLFTIFVFSWFFPYLTLMQYFTVIFGIYYLIMMTIINSKKSIA